MNTITARLLLSWESKDAKWKGFEAMPHLLCLRTEQNAVATCYGAVRGHLLIGRN